VKAHSSCRERRHVFDCGLPEAESMGKGNADRRNSPQKIFLIPATEFAFL